LEKLLEDYRSLISSPSGGDALELSTKNQQLNQEIAQLKAELASAASSMVLVYDCQCVAKY